MRRTLLTATSATILLAACTSAPAEKPDETTTEAATPDPAAQRAAWAKDSEAALALLTAMADGAKGYFESEQKITGQDHGEPWHDGGDETMYGYPVEWNKYVFPGGAGYTFTTHGEVPTGGTPAAMTLDPAAPEVSAALMKLGVTLPAESPFRYTYITGDGGGEAASATIVAEADFDPSTPELHTITVEVGVDDMTQEVVIAAPVVTNEFD
jgi:hypothetical protein